MGYAVVSSLSKIIPIFIRINTKLPIHMKHLCCQCCALVLVLCLSLSFSSAQDKEALAIIQRYEHASGLDKISNEEMSSWHIEATTNMEGVNMDIDMYYQDSTQLYAKVLMGDLELIMTMNGSQNATFTMNGETIPLPKEMAQALQKQLITPNSYRWNADDYLFTLADSMQVGKHICPGVQIIPKKTVPSLENSVVYFDPHRGMPVLLIATITEDGTTHQARCTYEAVKRYGDIKLPSRYVMTIDDSAQPVMDITIRSFKLGSSMPESLFEGLK